MRRIQHGQQRRNAGKNRNAAFGEKRREIHPECPVSRVAPMSVAPAAKASQISSTDKSNDSDAP